MFPRSSDNDFSTKKQVLELALLGPPEVRSDRHLLAFRTQKALALLVYLAVTGTPQPRSHLAALLWPDREDAQARATLRSTIRLVREAIMNSPGFAPSRDIPRIHSRHAEAREGLIRSGRDRLGRESLWLQEEAVRLDLQVIEQSAALTTQWRDRRPADSLDHLDRLRWQLETAAGQCRGPFLAGFTLDDAPDFADWIEQQRAYWQGRIDRVLNALSALQRQQGAFDAATQTAERWIKLNPLSEEAYRCLMESQLPAGEREQLCIKLGRAYEWVGALEQARSAYDALRLYAKERGALTLEAAALNRLAAVAWQQSWDFATAHALLNESLLLVVTTGDAAAIAETEWNLGQLVHWAGDFTLAQTHAHRALELATAAGLNELIARSLFLIGRSHNIAGEWDETIDPTMKSRAMYDTLVKQNKQGKTVSIASETSTIETLELGTQFLWTGLPPASPLDYRAGEAYCLDLLAMSRINLGEPQAGIEAAREGLRLARDINNATALVLNANKLQVGLAEVGEYEEAVHVAHEAGEFMQSSHDPALRWLQLFTLGDVKNTLFQLEEARAILDEAMALSETIPIGHWKSAIISRFCMNRVLAHDWPAASVAAQRSIAIRDALPAKLVWLDFHRYYEIAALLHEGHGALAREDVGRFGERVGNNRRFRLIHLRMQAALAGFEGRINEAIASLQEALRLAIEMGLPGEEWQIQAQFARLYWMVGQEVQAQSMRTRARDSLVALAAKILGAQLRMSFLNATQSILVLATLYIHS